MAAFSPAVAELLETSRELREDVRTTCARSAEIRARSALICSRVALSGARPAGAKRAPGADGVRHGGMPVPDATLTPVG